MAQSQRPRSAGPSQRQLRVGEAIRRRLAEVLARGEVHDPELNRIPITVSEVRTSPDLRQATAFVLPLGGQGRDAALALLRRNRGELRRAVARGLTLKFAPELTFVTDDSFDRMDATRRLLQDPAVQADLARPAPPSEPNDAAPAGDDADR